MTKKERSELQQLNQKFDVLIGLMTKQVQATNAKEPHVVPEAPVKKKRGRPRKIQVEAPKKPAGPPVDNIVTLFVTPSMNINGNRYEGHVKVKESIAIQLRHMMQAWEKYDRRTQQFIDHGVRDHGVIQ